MTYQLKQFLEKFVSISNVIPLFDIAKRQINQGIDLAHRSGLSTYSNPILADSCIKYQILLLQN